MTELLRQVWARLFPRAATRIAIPQRKYRDPSVAIRPVRGAFWHTRAVGHFDTVDAHQFNLGLVVENAPKGSISFLRSSWPLRPVLEMTSSDVAVMLVGLAATPYPVYVALARNNTDRVMRLDQRSGGFEPQAGDTLTIFTPHLESTTGRTYGKEHGCEIEVVAPESGSAKGIVRASYFGVELPLSSRVVGTGPFDVEIPIDIVYLWVDDTDEKWVGKREARMADWDDTRGRMSSRAALYQTHDELRYSLRSVERFAPWVRHIFLVTDDQRPDWLHDHQRLTIIDHREFLPPSSLPTFNSHAIVAGLHHIEGLSDHFLVMNDDVFFGKPVGPDRFFLSNGTAKFFISSTPLPSDPQTDHDFARVATVDLIERLTGRRPTNVFQHTPVAFNRSLLEALEKELPSQFRDTVDSPFRSSADLVVEYLHHYVGYQRRLTIPASIRYGYFGFGTPRGMAALEAYAGSEPAEVFCVNDLSTDETDLVGARSALRSILSSQFPNQASWEI
jgi:hypothetical protein